MTTDQTLTVFAILVWPFVALVSCWSLYLTARMVMSVLSDEKRRTREHQTVLALTVTKQLGLAADALQHTLVSHRQYLQHEASFETSRWIEFLSSVLQSTLPALVRAVANDQANSTKPNVPRTAEHALVALIGSCGGIPGRPKDETVRQLVHEVRKLYDELEHPTEPVRGNGDGDGGQDDDDLVSELFGGALNDEDLDDLDDDDGRARGAIAAMDEEI